MTPNLVSTLALFTWPVVALILYRTQSVAKATLWTILGAQMLLPARAFFKFEMIPAFDKGSISVYAAFFGTVFIAHRRVRFIKQIGIAEILVFIVILGPVVTSVLNTDPVRIGGAILPGVGIYDGLSAALSQLIMLLPFFLGRQFLRSSEDVVEILRTLVFAGLIYSLPMLFELRMSPILNIWIYGFSPSEMSQSFRDGGYRPIVFMGHGLVTAFFTMTTVVAAAALWRVRIRVWRLPSAGVTIYLGALLFFCKTAASLVYGVTGAILVRFTEPRMQMRIALMLTIIALLYPLLRSADLVPTNTILEQVSSVSTDRAGSLKTRFDQEHLLLIHAKERFLYGWGRFGRNRLYGAEGKDASATDGAWIVVVGQFGLIGFIGLFGLLALPVFRAASALSSAESARDGILLAALTLIVAFKIFDLLPNSGLDPWAWLLFGALLGRAEALKTAVRQQEVGVKRVTQNSVRAFSRAPGVK